MITKLTVTKLDEPRENGIVGFATATFDDTFLMNSISIRQKQDGSGLYVRLPQRKTKDGNYIDVAHPLTYDARQEMNKLILDCYQKGITNYDAHTLGIQDLDRNTVHIDAQNCLKYEQGKFGNTLARMDVVVNDMVIHNAKLYSNNNGEIGLSLPNYRDSKGNYHSICIPTDKAAFQELKTAAINEYKAEYSFKECTPAELKAIKDVGISVKEKQLPEGTFSVKFNSADTQRINNTLQAFAAAAKQSANPVIN